MNEPQGPTSARAAGFIPAEVARFPAWRSIPLGTLLLIALSFLLGCFEMENDDTWWHLRTGELIPSRGIPKTDWFCFSSEGNPWIDVHWGFQLFAAWIYHHLGVAGLILSKAAVCTLTFIFCLASYRQEWPKRVQILVWIPALLLMSSRFYIRPEIFTLWFTAIFLYVLLVAEERPGLLWCLPLVTVIWANFQGMFIFGPILLGMYGVEAALRLPKTARLWRTLLPVGILTGLAGAVSPYGFENILFVATLWSRMKQGANLYRENIAELKDMWTFWDSGGGFNPYALLLVLMLVLSALSVLLNSRAIVRDRRVFRVLPLVAFGWLSLQAVRNGNHFALVCGTITSWNLGEFFAQRGRSRKTSEETPNSGEFGFDAGEFGSGRISIVAVLIAWFVVASGWWYRLCGGERRFGLRLRPDTHAISTMKLAGLPGMPKRVAVFHLGHAATFIYFNGPEHRVLMDARLEVNSEQTFRNYIDLENRIKDPTGGGDWDAVLRANGIDMIFADGEYNAIIQAAVLVHPGWRCIDYNEVGALFVRKGVSLPEGVSDFDFRRLLFEPRPAIARAIPKERELSPTPEHLLPKEPLNLPKPKRWSFEPIVFDSWFFDKTKYEAKRSFNLASPLFGIGKDDPVLQQAIIWYSLRKSFEAARANPHAAEPFRQFGALLILLGSQDSNRNHMPRVLAPWNGSRDLFQAMGAYALRCVLEIDEDDYTANLMLNDSFSRIGAIDLSLEPLRRLAERRPTNALQVKMQQSKINDYEKLLAQVERKRKIVDPNPTTYDGLEKLAEAGLVDTAMEVDVSRFPSGTANDAWLDRFGTWSLLIGEPENAMKYFARFETEDVDEENDHSALYKLRLMQSHLAAGNYEAASERPSRTSIDHKIDVRFVDAVIAILRGERDRLDEIVKLAHDAPGDPEMKRFFNTLAELLEQK